MGFCLFTQYKALREPIVLPDVYPTLLGLVTIGLDAEVVVTGCEAQKDQGCHPMRDAHLRAIDADPRRIHVYVHLKVAARDTRAVAVVLRATSEGAAT